MPTKDEITTFSLEIETLAKKKNMSYMDAVIEYCESIGLEVEVAAKLISGALKSKIKMEAEDLHFLPKSNTAKLPF
jgi:phage-related tail protein